MCLGRTPGIAALVRRSSNSEIGVQPTPTPPLKCPAQQCANDSGGGLNRRARSGCEGERPGYIFHGKDPEARVKKVLDRLRRTSPEFHHRYRVFTSGFPYLVPLVDEVASVISSDRRSGCGLTS